MGVFKEMVYLALRDVVSRQGGDVLTAKQIILEVFSNLNDLMNYEIQA